MARAIWKGRILFEDIDLPVKLYSAIEDRKVHFRLLHSSDLAPVRQRLIRKDTGAEVPKEQVRKAFPIDEETLVILQPDELFAVEPEASREIQVCRFVDPALIDDRWYDRPYYLGPDGDDDAYFALADALTAADKEGIAQWTMRKRRYVGSMRARDGYLMMVTLRRIDQVMTLGDLSPPDQRAPDAREVRLAEQLVEVLSEDFDPAAWHDDLHDRICALIEARSQGDDYTVESPARERPPAGLAESLRQSLRAARHGHEARP